ncbi:MAG: hypothetical protein ACK559_11330, partial [bacterium]
MILLGPSPALRDRPARAVHGGAHGALERSLRERPLRAHPHGAAPSGHPLQILEAHDEAPVGRGLARGDAEQAHLARVRPREVALAAVLQREAPARDEP